MSEGNLRSTLTELLGQIQDGKEVRAYLSRFGAAGQTRFAIFKLGGAVIQDELETVAANLSLLNAMGLTPIVIHGAGPQLDKAVAEAGVDAGKVDGLRVSTPDVMKVVAATSMRASTTLAAAIHRHGASAIPVSPAAIKAKLIDPDRLGLVGDPEEIDATTISDLAKAGTIPLISNVGSSEDGRLVNINADAVARALALAFRPLKIVFVTGTGGLLDEKGNLITSINIDAELDRLVAEGTVHGGMKVKLEEIAKLLEPLPRSTSVSITSPKGLVRELFTHGGAGTLIRRGEAIERYDSLDNVDKPKLSSLIEEAFGKTLRPGFLDTFDLSCGFVSKDHRAAALITTIGGQAMLDKFVVAKSARGEGLSHTLWRMMSEAYPLIFWRSRRTNGFNNFYTERADGFVKRGVWNIYWTGDVSLNEAAPVIDAIASRPPSFMEDEE